MTGPDMDFAAFHEICRLQDRYGSLLDGGEHAAWLALFTDDAVLTVGQRRFAGRDGLETFLANRHPHVGKHVTGVPVVQRGDRGACTVEANFVALKRTADGLVVNGAGRYRDELRAAGGGWLIGAREVLVEARP